MSETWIFPDWPAPPKVRAVVSTRDGPGASSAPFGRFNLGSRSGDAIDAVASNRTALASALNLPHAPRWLHQVHAATVAELGPLAAQSEPHADAAVARIPGTVLTILSADCLPVLMCSDDGSEIAAAHAGWRGLAAGVLESTVASMTTPAARIMAWLGPCIGPSSYEVGVDVRDAFLKIDKHADAAFKPTPPGHWHCDLALLARQRLTACGVSQVHGGGFDTFTDPRLYSYRREGARSGRFASLIWTSG